MPRNGGDAQLDGDVVAAALAARVPMPCARAGLSTAEVAQRLQTQLQHDGRAGSASLVVLVEGLSDYFALETLAARRGLQLRSSPVSVVPMGGSSNLQRYATFFGPPGRGSTLAGLYDVAQERDVRNVLAACGCGHVRGREELEAIGFNVCDRDLEDELIRAHGTDGVEAVIEARGDLRMLRKMQRDPFHRTRTVEQHIHRFMGTRSGRKYRYARYLTETLDVTRTPAPLARLVDRIAALQ